MTCKCSHCQTGNALKFFSSQLEKHSRSALSRAKLICDYGNGTAERRCGRRICRLTVH